MEMEGGFTERDAEYMRMAIELAKRGEGRVAPNPPVGCVLVKDARVIAEGWHDRLGELHAEAMALLRAGDNAKGATAYVTLSPCTSFGRQPPCANALIKAEVAKVFVAAPDPNPGNATGVEVLNAAGIPTVSGLLRNAAECLARGFFKMMTRRRPHVTLKYAMTLDGKIAAASGDSKWISGEKSRELVQDMRSRSDAVLVGSGTALADDPLLNVRGAALESRGGPERHPQPFRVVVDSKCRLPATAAMLNPANGAGGPVIVACVRGANDAGADRLARAGATLLAFEPEDGKVPLSPLMDELGKRGINMVLCEGGGGLAAGLLRESLLDEVAVFVAPKIVGGSEAPGPVGGEGFQRMADATGVAVKEWFRVGDDIMIRGTIS